MPRNVLSIRSEAFLLSSAGDSQQVLTFHDKVRSQVGAMEEGGGGAACQSRQVICEGFYIFPSVTESGVKVA